jgi:hypothetical protein
LTGVTGLGGENRESSIMEMGNSDGLEFIEKEAPRDSIL